MQSFDQSLMQLVKQKLVTYEEALKNVSNPDDFALRFRGIGGTSDGTWDDFETDDEEKEGDVPGGGPSSSEAPAEGGDGKDDDFIQRF